MDLILTRSLYRKDGIFGELRDPVGGLVAKTLEHAFQGVYGNWHAVIPEGKYTCVRGEHYLHGMKKPFETFEVFGVEGHVGLLFHWGNFNKDSEGCILIGKDLVIEKSLEGRAYITESRSTFEEFMEMQAGLEYFNLLVIG